MIIFFIICFLLAFAASQSGREKRTYTRNRIGRFAKVEKKEKRVIPVKEGNKITGYITI